MKHLIKWCRQLKDVNSDEFKKQSSLKSEDLLQKHQAFIEQLTESANRTIFNQANVLVSKEDPTLTPLDSADKRRKGKGAAKSVSPPSRQ